MSMYHGSKNDLDRKTPNYVMVTSIDTVVFLIQLVLIVRRRLKMKFSKYADFEVKILPES